METLHNPGLGTFTDLHVFFGGFGWLYYLCAEVQNRLIMKGKLFLLGAATLLFAACTEELQRLDSQALGGGITTPPEY